MLVKVIRILDRDDVIEGLIRLRQEWQEATNGKPLIEVQGNIGLILADVVNTLGLLPDEAEKVLSGEDSPEPDPIAFFASAEGD